MSTLTEAREPEVREQPGLAVNSPKIPVPTYPALFADVLLETGHGEKHRRRWATISSVMFQCLALGILFIVPLMFTEALPKAQLLTFLVAPPPPPPPPPPPAAAPPVQVVRHIESDILGGQLRTPSRIPQKIQMIKEEEAPPIFSGAGVVGGVPGGIPGGQLGGVIGGIVNSSNAGMVPKLSVVAPKRVRVSQGVIQGLLIHKVEPEYPALARQARIQGDVMLTAVISKDGTIENLQVVSGHPLLLQSAVQAVKQWRYRPFLVSGEPTEVETKITVAFRLAG